MRQVSALLLMSWALAAPAETTQQVVSGPIQFTKVEPQRGSPQQTIRLNGNLDLVFNLSALTDEKGREFIDAPSEARNKTSATLHYVAYVALYDQKKNLVAVLNSEDVFSRGVAHSAPTSLAHARQCPVGRPRTFERFRPYYPCPPSRFSESGSMAT